MPRINKLLIAGRGEIPRRIMRTARDMGISTVAVYADGDREWPFVREADEAVSLRGVTAIETYLDVVKIIDAARRTGADAVHPCYGFLAEDSAFASAVTDVGLTWVGPHPKAIAAMGDKLSAKDLMIAANVPTLPAIGIDGRDESTLLTSARELGYPLLVKAAAGGGGKGMRVVNSEPELAEAVAGARREASGAFGSDTVFVERYLTGARHVEVQVFGDRHGNVVHCFERECSIQRRHQKIVEEAPSPAVSDDLRARMGEAAVSAAKAIGYDNAGTVEFLLDSEGRFYFLEMNTRLQVEHPVTEEITGLDLVREQIRVAEGEPLSFRQEDLRIEGHSIEVRLYAEDPANDFLPSAGRLITWQPDPAFHVRIESGVETSSIVTPLFDPMLAKVISHAPTRTEAAERLARALQHLRIHGVATNRDFLINVLQHEAFLAGDTRTDFIEYYEPPRARALPPNEVRHAALAAALFAQRERRLAARTLATIPTGWRNNPSQMQQTTYLHKGDEIRVGYIARRDGSFAFEVGEISGEARIVHGTGDRIEIEIDGLLRPFTIAADESRFWVQTTAGEVALVELPRFPDRATEAAPGSYSAPMPGKIVALNVETGQEVQAGQLLLILEAMKMEHRITCSQPGIVKEILITVGAQVEAGQPLLVIEDAEGHQ